MGRYGQAIGAAAEDPALPFNFWKYLWGTSFLGAFAAFVLSLRNLGLEFRKLVLYYSFAREASYPMAPTL
jgi:hypothetical protein